MSTVNSFLPFQERPCLMPHKKKKKEFTRRQVAKAEIKSSRCYLLLPVMYFIIPPECYKMNAIITTDVAGLDTFNKYQDYHVPHFFFLCGSR